MISTLDIYNLYRRIYDVHVIKSKTSFLRPLVKKIL